MPTLLDRPISEKAWLTEAGRRKGASAASSSLDGVNGGQKTVRDAGPWQPAVEKMMEFQHLEDNWDGQGAQVPSYELLASAIGLAYTLLDQGVDPPHCVVPGVDGTVTFEWHDPNGTYTEVEIIRPLYAEAMMIEPGQPPQHWTLPTE